MSLLDPGALGPAFVGFDDVLAHLVQQLSSPEERGVALLSARRTGRTSLLAQAAFLLSPAPGAPGWAAAWERLGAIGVSAPATTPTILSLRLGAVGLASPLRVLPPHLLRGLLPDERVDGLSRDVQALERVARRAGGPALEADLRGMAHTVIDALVDATVGDTGALVILMDEADEALRHLIDPDQPDDDSALATCFIRLYEEAVAAEGRLKVVATLTPARYHQLHLTPPTARVTVALQALLYEQVLLRAWDGQELESFLRQRLPGLTEEARAALGAQLERDVGRLPPLIDNLLARRGRPGGWTDTSSLATLLDEAMRPGALLNAGKLVQEQLSGMRLALGCTTDAAWSRTVAAARSGGQDESSRALRDLGWVTPQHEPRMFLRPLDPEAAAGPQGMAQPAATTPTAQAASLPAPTAHPTAELTVALVLFGDAGTALGQEPHGLLNDMIAQLGGTPSQGGVVALPRDGVLRDRMKPGDLGEISPLSARELRVLASVVLAGPAGVPCGEIAEQARALIERSPVFSQLRALRSSDGPLDSRSVYHLLRQRLKGTPYEDHLISRPGRGPKQGAYRLITRELQVYLIDAAAGELVRVPPERLLVGELG